MSDFDTCVHQTHHVHCALSTFTVNVHSRIYLDVKPVIWFYMGGGGGRSSSMFMS